MPANHLNISVEVGDSRDNLIGLESNGLSSGIDACSLGYTSMDNSYLSDEMANYQCVHSHPCNVGMSMGSLFSVCVLKQESTIKELADVSANILLNDKPASWVVELIPSDVKYIVIKYHELFSLFNSLSKFFKVHKSFAFNVGSFPPLLNLIVNLKYCKNGKEKGHMYPG